MSCRIAQGGAIDRQQSIRFRFDGKDYSGCAGDSLASALLANDVRLVGRSFKYHRPRGILSAGCATIRMPSSLVPNVPKLVRKTVVFSRSHFDGLKTNGGRDARGCLTC